MWGFLGAICALVVHPIVGKQSQWDGRERAVLDESCPRLLLPPDELVTVCEPPEPWTDGASPLLLLLLSVLSPSQVRPEPPAQLLEGNVPSRRRDTFGIWWFSPNIYLVLSCLLWTPRQWDRKTVFSWPCNKDHGLKQTKSIKRALQ